MVVTALPPVASLLAETGGGLIEVMALLGPGDNPHTFALSPGQLQRMSRAQAYFLTGLEFEEVLRGKLERALPHLSIVDLREGLELRPISAVQVEVGAAGGEKAGVKDPEHRHNDEGTCCPHEEAGAIDPHIWLHAQNCRQMAVTAAAHFRKLRPADEEALWRSLRSVESKAEVLHAALSEQLAPFAGRGFFVYHAAFGYFAGAYKLEQFVLEAGGKAPSARQIATFAAHAREHQARAIFIQPQFNPRPARRLAEAIGGTVAALDPLHAPWDENLRLIADSIEASFQSAKEERNSR